MNLSLVLRFSLAWFWFCVEFTGCLLELRVLNISLFLVLILHFLEHHTDKGVATLLAEDKLTQFLQGTFPSRVVV